MDLISTAGHDLEINGVQFRIIGIIKRENSLVTPFTSIVVHVPLTVAREEFAHAASIQRIYCLAIEKNGAASVQDAEDQVREVLRSHLRIENL